MFMDECTLYNYADDNSLFRTAPTIDAVIQISSWMATELSNGLMTTGCKLIPKVSIYDDLAWWKL